MTYVQPATSVVYRHPCDCASASRPLAEGEHPEHRFDVDGEPFPWAMTVEGPTFTRVLDDLYRVNLTLLPVVMSNRAVVGVEVVGGFASALVIGGVAFPWSLTDTVTISCARGQMTSVELAFLARDVDTDVDVTDGRGRAVYDVDGSYYGGQEHCPECDEAVDRDGYFNHYFTRHPDRMKFSDGGMMTGVPAL